MLKEKNNLEKVANNERMINHSALFFKSEDPIIGSHDFLKRFGTLYDLLIDLLSEKIDITKAAKEQNELTKK